MLAVTLAACGGDDGGAGSRWRRSRSAPTREQGRHDHLLQTSVTEHLDPQRIYVGRDISNLGRLVYRGLVTFPAGATDPAEGTTPIPDLATDTGTANEDATEW